MKKNFIKHSTVVYADNMLSHTNSTVTVYLPETSIVRNTEHIAVRPQQKKSNNKQYSCKIITQKDRDIQNSNTTTKTTKQKHRLSVKSGKITLLYNIYAHKHPQKEVTKQLKRRRLAKLILQGLNCITR